MRGAVRLALVAACAAGLLTFAASASATHATRADTENMQALGHSPDPGSFLLPDGQSDVNSDLAFWRNEIYHGDYDGFRILKSRGRGDDPRLISRTRCNGDQGDIVVYKNVLVRSWNAAKNQPRNCDGTTVEAGFEGVHVFDISNRRDPELVADIELSARPQADAFGCGSHTATAVPDLRNRRLIIYNATSGGPCPFVSIIEVPLRNPEDARWLRNEPLVEADAVHDNGVILGDVNLLAAAAHDHTNVYDIGRNDTPGGSLEDPRFLYTISEPGVCNDGLGGQPGVPAQRPCNGNWHSATFTWDGEVVILGWEPGGGSQPECEAQDPPVKKSMFFYDADTGAKLGQWTLPNPQTAAENCTIHNYNVLPLRSGRYIVAGGHYQAGTWLVEFTNPAAPVALGWSDPPPAAPIQLGGAWSTYWYNGLMYESVIQEGLNIFRYTGSETRGEIRLKNLNPQTQEFSLDARRDDDDDNGGGGDDDDTDDNRGGGRDDDTDDNRGGGRGGGRGDSDSDSD